MESLSEIVSGVTGSKLWSLLLIIGLTTGFSVIAPGGGRGCYYGSNGVGSFTKNRIELAPHVVMRLSEIAFGVADI